MRVQSQLDDVRIDLDSVGDGVLRSIPATRGYTTQLSGLSLKPILNFLRRANQSPEQFLGLDANGNIPEAKIGELSKTFKAVTAMGRLSGKSVRLTYVNGKGIISLEAVKGDMTLAEQDFHRASVLLSDSLIVPDVAIKPGIQWLVDGSSFGSFIDPSLLARTTGDIWMEREKNILVQGKECLQLNAVKGTIYFEDSNPREASLGSFTPKGSVYFSLNDQMLPKYP